MKFYLTIRIVSVHKPGKSRRVNHPGVFDSIEEAQAATLEFAKGEDPTAHNEGWTNAFVVRTKDARYYPHIIQG